MMRAQAFLDLMRRYKAVFGAAWAIRDQLRSPPRQGYELAFLPANLELAETPVHPAPRMAMRAIALLAVLILLIGLIGRLDIVVAAKGKLVPNDRVKVIQPAVTGVVRRILVADGQKVTVGDLLLEFDPTQAVADTSKAHSAKTAAALASARARALLEAQKSGRPPVLATIDIATPDEVEDARRLAEGEFREYQDKLAHDRAELARREAELDGTLHEIDKLQVTAPLAREQANDYKALVEGKLVAKHDYLEREEDAVAQEHDLQAKTSHAVELRAGLTEQQAGLAQLASQFRREQLDALEKANQQQEQSGEDETKAVSRRQLMSLSAPVSGTVQQLAVHTVGGVVTTAQSLMEIVPEDALEVDVNIENKDVGFVQAGQEAIIKVEAFPYTRYGYLRGTVRQVSNDAAQDRRQGLVFTARVQLPTDSMQINGQMVRLTPGMAVGAEIKTGRRSVIEYFLDPLMRTTQESLRER
ncbi:MAG TPA: HlyD family type I secretion periplasmic adaptor subunit [Magnetospirillaceae bacterium]|nr:HlyD family type I secretion periplasmic adaptor subunit [Magnetospirillaceae bacterium]